MIFQSDEIISQYNDLPPLKAYHGFYGEKEDCAYIVRLLCSDEGRYITGQSIFVDGGKSL